MINFYTILKMEDFNMMTTCGIGRLVRDPEIRQVRDGETHVCDFSLAVNEYRKINGERKEFAHFFDFVVWDKAAELIAEHCQKGDELQVVATPRLDRWEDSEGNKRSRVVFRVNEFQFLRKARRNEAVEEVEAEEKEVEETPF